MDKLNDAVESVNGKLKAVVESKEKLIKILTGTKVHSMINSIYGPLLIIIIILITILSKGCKPCRERWLSNSGQQEENPVEVQTPITKGIYPVLAESGVTADMFNGMYKNIKEQMKDYPDQGKSLLMDIVGATMNARKDLQRSMD